MKEEIKEILDYFETNVANNSIYMLKLDTNEAKILLDYITNLQEENEILKELNVCVGCNNNPNYKQRIEKAIDKIQYIIDYGFDYDGFNTVESLKGLIDMLVDYARQSKDILKGDKDE